MLYPIYRRATKMENYQRKVSLVEGSLIVDNVHYSVDSLDGLPESLHPKNFCEKTDGRCRVFGGLYSEFSVFTYKNKTNKDTCTTKLCLMTIYVLLIRLVL